MQFRGVLQDARYRVKQARNESSARGERPASEIQQ
jgi:hypothetical protein